MKTIITALAITALGTTLAFAQATNGSGSGSAGATGGAGVSGTAGTTGTNGTAGANGTVGTNGTTGTAGTNGNNGENGSTTGTAGTNGNSNNSNSDTTAQADGTSSTNKDECTEMLGRVHTGTDTNFSDSEAEPYLGKMSSMNMSTQMKGKLTSDEFVTACRGGAFKGMK